MLEVLRFVVQVGFGLHQLTGGAADGVARVEAELVQIAFGIIDLLVITVAVVAGTGALVLDVNQRLRSMSSCQALSRSN